MLVIVRYTLRESIGLPSLRLVRLKSFWMTSPIKFSRHAAASGAVLIARRIEEYQELPTQVLPSLPVRVAASRPLVGFATDKSYTCRLIRVIIWGCHDPNQAIDRYDGTTNTGSTTATRGGSIVRDFELVNSSLHSRSRVQW